MSRNISTYTVKYLTFPKIDIRPRLDYKTNVQTYKEYKDK